MPHLAIVVLVAVVAIVVLVLNVRMPSEEAVAGEASRVVRLIPTLDCEAFRNPSVNLDPSYETKTHEEICRDQSFHDCVQVEYWGSYIHNGTKVIYSDVGNCNAIYSSGLRGMESQFINLGPSATDIGINAEVVCCRIK